MSINGWQSNICCSHPCYILTFYLEFIVDYRMQGVNGNLTVDTVQMSPIGDTPATLDECIVYAQAVMLKVALLHSLCDHE